MNKMISKNFSIGGGDVRPYAAPTLEVLGIDLQQSIMVGSGITTPSLDEEDFEW